MSRPKQRKGGRVTPKGTGSTKGARPAGASSPGLPMPDVPDLSGLLDPEDFLPDLVPLDADAGDERQLDLAIRAALGTGDPADLLALASMIAEQIADHERGQPS